MKHLDNLVWRSYMTWFQKKVLKIIMKKVVRQGNQKVKITHFLVTLIHAARNEYTEDNKVTLDCFLKECFNDACAME